MSVSQPGVTKLKFICKTSSEPFLIYPLWKRHYKTADEEEPGCSLPPSPTDSRQTADLQQTGCSLRTQKLQYSATAKTETSDTGGSTLYSSEGENSRERFKNTPVRQGQLRQQDQSGAVVFLHSIRAPRSISPSCRHFCKKKKKTCSFCLFTCFIIYAVNCKLLQNKLKRSRKVTQTAVRPVAAAGGGSWTISYLVLPESLLCEIHNLTNSLINDPN